MAALSLVLVAEAAATYQRNRAVGERDRFMERQRREIAA